jgi:hypothetical protein
MLSEAGVKSRLSNSAMDATMTGDDLRAVQMG